MSITKAFTVICQEEMLAKEKVSGEGIEDGLDVETRETSCPA